MDDWEPLGSVFPEEQRAVYEAAGYGQPGGLGTSPALLVIDITYGFVGRRRLSALESIREYPNSCGYQAWDAVAAVEKLMGPARTGGWPVFYTAGTTDNMVHHAGRWRDKHPKTLEQPSDAHEIVAEIAPCPGDIVIHKTKPSAFFGTPLASSLIDLRIDTLVIAGGTTSGCVRASVVDAFSYGFSVAVARDGVFDRAQLSHDVTLFELNQKYADVVPVSSLVRYAEELADDGPSHETG